MISTSLLARSRALGLGLGLGVGSTVVMMHGVGIACMYASYWLGGI